MNCNGIKTERLKSQEKLDKQRANKWSQELLKLNSKPYDLTHVHDEEAIKRERWAIMHDTCYGSGEFWTLVKAVFPDDAREYAVKIIRTKEWPKGLDESFFKKERLKIFQSLQHQSSSILGKVL